MSSAPGAPPELRWTPRAYAVLGIGGAFLLLAIVARTPSAVFVSVPALLAPLVAALLARGEATTIEPIAWKVDGSGASVEIVGRLTAPPGSEGRLWPRLETPADLEAAGPPEVRVEGDALEFRLHLRAVRPTLSIVLPPRVVWRDPMGLLEGDVAAPGEPLVVERYPSDLVRKGAVRLDRTQPLPGETRSRRRGASGEFFGLREAGPTEPLRSINWRATARSGRMLANEFEQDRTGDVLLLIDARPTPNGPVVDARAMSTLRAAALGIAESFLRDKSRVGLAVFGEFLEAVPLGSGRIQRIRIRDALSHLRLASVAGPSERSAVALPRYFRPGITTLLLTTLTGDAAVDLVALLRRRGYSILVLAASPLALRDPGPTLRPEDEGLATRFERIERRERLARVWSHAPVVDWSDLWSLAGLVRLLRRPVRRRA